ncbi:INPP1 [Lepeophtheirus salmonis]|uniref:INPP1 n=1 Tax=Lepeophtheirus salmonis TaxID=72036 RepID=A0A7R8CJP4_LEPSM|nr:INPP1 [Lepeophtheirus salmonis]CAF2843696.1 INPP1 [Lepeophtheirus salmonis]
MTSVRQFVSDIEKECGERPDFKTLGRTHPGDDLNTSLPKFICPVQKEEEDTARLLESVLDGHDRSAKTLASLIHTKDVNVGGSVIEDILESIPKDLELDVSNVALWVDPIDSTSNYIRGTEGSPLSYYQCCLANGLQSNDPI